MNTKTEEKILTQEILEQTLRKKLVFLSTWKTPAIRFFKKMIESNITAIGEYRTLKSEFSYSCRICNKTWTETAEKGLKYKCPNCSIEQKYKEKDAWLWKRSQRILDDKHGIIINKPTITKKPSVKDSFVLECEHGHRFEITHKELRDNRWCPHCKANLFIKERQSNHVYRKGMSIEEKFSKYQQIAEVKGVKILNQGPLMDKKRSAKYNVLCIVCGETMQRTARQICEKKYICKNKCIQGGKFSIHSSVYV